MLTAPFQHLSSVRHLWALAPTIPVTLLSHWLLRHPRRNRAINQPHLQVQRQNVRTSIRQLERPVNQHVVDLLSPLDRNSHRTWWKPHLRHDRLRYNSIREVATISERHDQTLLEVLICHVQPSPGARMLVFPVVRAIVVFEFDLERGGKAWLVVEGGGMNTPNAFHRSGESLWVASRVVCVAE